ncbi:MAG: translation initiation factor IF-2 [Candidatus Aminicenantes bacterium]|nr:translation initiation factor IF-2 [Candidatus Aminicenantes bacterium]
MQTIKLHEATKQFKISNKLAMFFLEKKNLPVKSHSSVISMDQLELLREFSTNMGKISTIKDEFDNIGKAKKDKSEKITQPEKEKVVTKEAPVEAKPGDPVKEKVEVKEIRIEKLPPKKPKPEAKEEKPAAAKKSDNQIKDKKDLAPVKEEEKPKKKEERPDQEKKKPETIRKESDRDKLKDADVKDKDGKAGTEEKKIETVKDRPKEPKKKTYIKSKGFKRGDRRPFKKDMRRFDPRKRRFEKEKKVELPPVKRQLKAEDFDLPEMIQISNHITIKELAEKLDLKLKYVEEKLRSLKKDYAANQMLDIEDINELCKTLKVEVDIVPFEDYIFINHIEKFSAKLTSRLPVVTVMGHVDHGKTTLLDTLRNTRVAAKEAGGITQKIGAYKLTAGGRDIIFLDTPGHEAFTNIRSRGALVTDLVILMVAANEGVKPQTIEAINHALSAGVPIIVAINKIDIAGADPNKVKQELTKHNIVVEDWGGDVVSVEISAKLNQNINSLLEMVGLVAEMLELKAYQGIPGRGTIIEARLDPKLGPIATVLIQHGTVKRGDFFICGNSVGKAKSIFDDNGKTSNEAEAPLPVEIMGFDEVPEAGEKFQVIDDLEKARKVIDIRKLKGKKAKKEEIDAEKKLNLQNLFEKMEEAKTPEFPIIVKTDNFSSGEVLENIILKQNQDHLKINIIHNGIGNITESDILLSSTSGAMIIGFNVKAPQKIISLAKREGIEIKLYNVIYHLIEDIEKAIKGEIKPEYIEARIGSIEVLQKFKISKIGIIAGCLVKEGKVTNKSKLKVIRKDDLVFEGEIETLRRVKNEASEVNVGTECGIKIKNFNDIEIGDILEAYEVKLKE